MKEFEVWEKVTVRMGEKEGILRKICLKNYRGNRTLEIEN
jgi:hypothetical protein